MIKFIQERRINYVELAEYPLTERDKKTEIFLLMGTQLFGESAMSIRFLDGAEYSLTLPFHQQTSGERERLICTSQKSDGYRVPIVAFIPFRAYINTFISYTFTNILISILY